MLRLCFCQLEELKILDEVHVAEMFTKRDEKIPVRRF